MTNLQSVLDKVSKRIASETDKQAIIDYLDFVESMIAEVPYGDIIYEYAYEVAQVKLQTI